MTATNTLTRAVREARRELTRAERALARSGHDTALASITRERRDAAALRFIALTGHGACRGRYLESVDEHAAHAREADQAG